MDRWHEDGKNNLALLAVCVVLLVLLGGVFAWGKRGQPCSGQYTETD